MVLDQVCKPVGMRLMQVARENHWKVGQIASKYRNPSHAPSDRFAENALAEFAENPDLMGFWERETLDGEEGIRYFRRINIEASCLACHGLKDDRPQFVKDNYPQDLAFDFNVGDLRGMYGVFIPDPTRAAIEASLNSEQ